MFHTATKENEIMSLAGQMNGAREHVKWNKADPWTQQCMILDWWGAGSEGMVEHQADYRLMKTKGDAEE